MHERQGEGRSPSHHSVRKLTAFTSGRALDEDDVAPRDVCSRALVLSCGLARAQAPGPGNAFQDFGYSHWHNSLIWGENVEDVSITGSGRINGRGLSRGLGGGGDGGDGEFTFPVWIYSPCLSRSMR